MARKKNEAVIEPIVDITETVAFRNTYSPSKYVSYNTIDIYRVEMSCGGGMGGAHWSEFVTEDIQEHEGNMLIKRTNIYGKEIKINTKWVVKTEKVKVGIYVEDITAWANYRNQDVPKGKKMYHTIAFWYDPSKYEYVYDASAKESLSSLDRKIDIIRRKEYIK